MVHYGFRILGKERVEVSPYDNVTYNGMLMKSGASDQELYKCMQRTERRWMVDESQLMGRAQPIITVSGVIIR